MSDTVIKVENISKQYRLGAVGTGTFSHDINRWWHKMRGKEDPYLKVGEVNDRSVKGSSGYVWALRDLNFEVKHGEILGIIGRNGAGKSTLLKILSRTTTPSYGNIRLKGRIASLLEVGTGFHPELSGKENVFLNGAILGMTRNEIKSKFDEIVDFAGVERYIDTPVKRYSSGMYVRLAFAVAAHLEPEILIIDEVLAVGDAEFQKKCLGKMKDISDKDGRTVLFVSHNMGALRSLCTKGIVLQNGNLAFQGTADNAVSVYLSRGAAQRLSDNLLERTDRSGNKKLLFSNVEFMQNGIPVDHVISGDSLTIRVAYNVYHPIQSSKLIIALNFVDSFQNIVAAFVTDEMGIVFPDNLQSGTFSCDIPQLLLRGGSRYNLRLLAFEGTTQADAMLDCIEEASTLNVYAGDFWRVGSKNREGEFALIPGMISI